VYLIHFNNDIQQIKLANVTKLDMIFFKFNSFRIASTIAIQFVFEYLFWLFVKVFFIKKLMDFFFEMYILVS